MLELNLNDFPSSSIHDVQVFGMQMNEYSAGTSNFSVVNVVDTSSNAGEEYSNQCYHEHCFDILKPRIKTKQLFPGVQVQVQQVKKSRRGPRSKSSQYKGVTFYRRTGRWELHIWDTGKQVYLGGFETAHAAAR